MSIQRLTSAGSHSIRLLQTRPASPARFGVLKLHRPSPALTPSRSLATASPFTSPLSSSCPSLLRTNRSKGANRSKYFARYCSHQRMCRREADMMDQNAIDVAKGREVLPKNVKPLHYHLTLEPNFETFEYEGKVVIEYASRRLAQYTDNTWLINPQSGRRRGHHLYRLEHNRPRHPFQRGSRWL